jgi:DNA-binding transcriptional LysR family regulator
MNIGQLRFASALARTASFSKAADQCCVSQPTLSTAVAQLESELGARLFDRTKRSVSLTAFGRHILPLVDQVLAGLAELDGSAKAFLNPNPRIARIGVSPVADMRKITAVLEPYRAAHPGVDIFFKECFLGDLEERLAADQIDIAVWPRAAVTSDQGGSSELEHQLIYRDPLLYLGSDVSADHPLVSIDDIGKGTLITTSGLCGLAQVIQLVLGEGKRNVRYYPGHAVSYAMVEEWVELGIGGAILPQSKLTRANAAARPLVMSDSKTAIAMDVVASWFGSARASEHVKALRSIFSAEAN